MSESDIKLAADDAALSPFAPPRRLLMGAGPINCDPRILQALATPFVGQYDPAILQGMDDVQRLYRYVFQTANTATALVDGTSRAGMEAALGSIISAGDRVLVPVFGRFGELIIEIVERHGAEAIRIDVPWGSVFEPEQVIAAIRRLSPDVVAVVHGETSTTMMQPLADIGAECVSRGILLYTDATASLGGNEFRMDAWHVDAVSTGLQKCLGGPPGSAPVSVSPAALERIRRRHRTEAGMRLADDPVSDDPIPSNYLDLGQILRYWSAERLNHHTEATSMLYAARECGRLLALEGLTTAVARHRLAGSAIAGGLEALGLELFGDQAHRLNNTVGVRIPAGIDGERVRRALLADFGIEIGTSFGPLAGRIWRIGAMGYNARRDAVLTTLSALGTVLAAEGAARDAAAGARAAAECFDEGVDRA